MQRDSNFGVLGLKFKPSFMNFYLYLFSKDIFFVFLIQLAFNHIIIGKLMKKGFKTLSFNDKDKIKSKRNSIRFDFF